MASLSPNEILIADQAEQIKFFLHISFQTLLQGKIAQRAICVDRFACLPKVFFSEITHLVHFNEPNMSKYLTDTY